MATWKISNYHKKNAVETQYWHRDDKVIIREEGFRWGTWYCTSDTKPDIDLRNPDGYEVNFSDYEWELDSMDDGCWGEIRAGRNATEEDVREFETAWEENWYEGVEDLGWTLDDTENTLYGPLQLENEVTGETWNGEETVAEDWDPATELAKIVLPTTDWFPVNINPVRTGRYETSDGDFNTTWPFPFYADWDGDRWSEPDVKFWRGLTEDPSK